MSELTIKRDIETITGEILAIQRQTQRLALGYAIEIGRRLVEAKEMLQHGEWGSWLRERVDFSERTAQRMMKLYEEYAEVQIGIFGAELNPTYMSDLSYTKALALLAVPEEEREEFAEEVDAANISVAELERVIREREKAMADLQREHEKALDGLVALESDYQMTNEQLGKLQKELAELKARPIDVAVERDEDAIKTAADEAQAIADEHWKKEVAALEAKIEGMQKKRDKAEQAAKAAEAKAAAAEARAGGATEPLEREIEGLKKQLAMSDSATTEFKAYFGQVQEIINKLLDLVEAANEEQCAKFSAALTKLLQATLEKVSAA